MSKPSRQRITFSGRGTPAQRISRIGIQAPSIIEILQYYRYDCSLEIVEQTVTAAHHFLRSWDASATNYILLSARIGIQAPLIIEILQYYRYDCSLQIVEQTITAAHHFLRPWDANATNFIILSARIGIQAPSILEILQYYRYDCSLKIVEQKITAAHHFLRPWDASATNYIILSACIGIQASLIIEILQYYRYDCSLQIVEQTITAAHHFLRPWDANATNFIILSARIGIQAPSILEILQYYRYDCSLKIVEQKITAAHHFLRLWDASAANFVITACSLEMHPRKHLAAATYTTAEMYEKREQLFVSASFSPYLH